MISSELAFRGNTGPLVRDIVNSRTALYNPLPGWNSAGNNIVFHIPPAQSEWISSTFNLDFKFKVTQADGSDLTPADSVAFLSLPIASFWSSVRLSLNNTVVEGLNNDWSMRTWASSLLNLNYMAKQYYGKDLWRWIADSAFRAQDMNDQTNSGGVVGHCRSNGGNVWVEGWAARRLLCDGSETVQVFTPIPLDFSTSGLAIANGTSIELTLVNAKNTARLMSNQEAGYLVNLLEVQLHVQYLTLSDDVMRTMESKLSVGPLTYPHFVTSVLAKPTISRGIREAVLPISRGQVPEVIAVGLLDTRYLEDRYRPNWQDLQSNNLEFLQCQLEGNFYPQDGLIVDFANAVNTYPLYQQFLELGKSLSGDGCTSYAEWSGDQCLSLIQLAEQLPSLEYRAAPFPRVPYAAQIWPTQPQNSI